MKRGLLIGIDVVLVLALGAILLWGHSHRKNACRLLDTAVNEAQMSEGWYIQAGQVLALCGIKDAPERAAGKACHARRIHDASEVCQ